MSAVDANHVVPLDLSQGHYFAQTGVAVTSSSLRGGAPLISLPSVIFNRLLNRLCRSSHLYYVLRMVWCPV